MLLLSVWVVKKMGTKQLATHLAPEYHSEPFKFSAFIPIFNKRGTK